MYGLYGEYAQQSFWPIQSPLVSLVELRALHEYAYSLDEPPCCLSHGFYQQYQDYRGSSRSTNDLEPYEGIFTPQPRPQAQQIL